MSIAFGALTAAFNRMVRVGRIASANSEASQYYGYPLDALQAMSVYRINLLPPAELDEAMRQAAFAWNFEYEPILAILRFEKTT